MRGNNITLIMMMIRIFFYLKINGVRCDVKVVCTLCSQHLLEKGRDGVANS